MSQRDRTHLMTALADAAQARAGVGVPLATLDEAIGRSRRDMRTPLDLRQLEAEGLVEETAADTWALTQAGIEHLREDQELSGR